MSGFLRRAGFALGLPAVLVAVQIGIVVGIAKIGHQTRAERCHARIQIRPDILT